MTMVHFDAKLSGSVEDMSLADLLQLFHFARKSVTVHVSGSRGGSVVMVDGEIRHAECAETHGEDALAALLAQKLVRVRTCPVAAASPRTVRRAFGAVVLDVLRRNDEHERDTGDLPGPSSGVDPGLSERLTEHLMGWLDARPDVQHAALIDPREHYVLACVSPSLWRGLVQSLLLQTLVAPYFDDAFGEIDDALLPPIPGAYDPGEDKQTVVTFRGRRYVLGFVPEHGWVAAMIFDASMVTHGLSLTHMVSLRQAVPGWTAGDESSRRALAALG